MSGKPEEKQRKPGATWRGWAKPDDPIYTGAGWNFLIGKNLSQTVTN